MTTNAKMRRKIYSYGRIHVVIVESNPMNSTVLEKLLLEKFTEESKLIGSYVDLQLAMNDILDMPVDLIFLSVDFRDFNVLQVVHRLPEEMSKKIILMSRNEKFALKALKLDVFDFLLTPVSIDDLRVSFKRFERRVRVPNILHEDFVNDDILIVNRQDKAVFVEVRDIVRLEANGSYTEIYMDNGTRLSSTKNIMFYEERLKKQRFYKVHRSHIVNLTKVREMLKYDGDGVIIMQDNSKISISRSRKSEFLKALTRKG